MSSHVDTILNHASAVDIDPGCRDLFGTYNLLPKGQGLNRARRGLYIFSGVPVPIVAVEQAVLPRDEIWLFFWCIPSSPKR